MFAGPSGAPVTPQPQFSQEQLGFGTLLERLLMAQMPYMSSWALRPETYPKYLPDNLRGGGRTWHAIERVGQGTGGNGTVVAIDAGDPSGNNNNRIGTIR